MEYIYTRNQLWFSGVSTIEDELPNLWSLSAPIVTSRIASARVYGLSWLALRMGSNILARKSFRVLFALRMRIDDIVHGKVELVPTYT